ncbi:M14 family metallopeptidase [Galbibacter sp.]|uniref:M14 family metallopeptidase n=1 Tax=Galbibacter sp. TaxID=2918471 RepID=UPI002CD45349|nr:M14 family metallopeptidase [Galbibacter sp.]HLV62046.1 M14 family metallopeptidase [Galbibacter sp.]
MKKYFLITLTMVCFGSLFAQNNEFTTIFERSNAKETATYTQVIDFYKRLSQAYPTIKVIEKGITDAGLPLHLVLLNPDQNFNIDQVRKHKRVLLINNGIHPGEPDGIDATMMLYRDIAQGKIKSPKHTLLATIPIYNIGGSLNRNNHSRTNQNGPMEYGFRGNAKNYDLNRDFVKSDSKNAFAFAAIYHELQPDVFIDNHVSNGADYQYILTHLFTQHNKLGSHTGKYLNQELKPALIASLKEKHFDMTPYVNVFNQVPEKGFAQFFDSPRYSTGYTTLWNTLGMMVETHMLKSYDKRVYGTYELISSMIDLIEKDYVKIKQVRAKSQEEFQRGKTYPITWEVAKDTATLMNFKGFEAKHILSKVTGLSRLKYDRSKPFTKPVRHYDTYKPVKTINIPEAYLIPAVWDKVIERIKVNQIEMQLLESEQELTVAVYHIQDYQTAKSPYEGHYLHKNTQVKTSTEQIHILPGTYYRVPTQQPGIRYILETLEPEAVDSFFNWNFFDTILQQKEGFSPYVWEDVAYEFLEKNPSIKNAFETKRRSDTTFANNWYLQLDWIHKKSPYYEKAHTRYPIYRIP